MTDPTHASGLPCKLLLCFSVLRNGRKILNTTRNHSDISCLHGIRVFGITWVILGHSFSQLGLAQGGWIIDNRDGIANQKGNQNETEK